MHPSQLLPMVLEHVTGNHYFKLKETPEVQFTPEELMLSIWVNGITCPWFYTESFCSTSFNYKIKELIKIYTEQGIEQMFYFFFLLFFCSWAGPTRPLAIAHPAGQPRLPCTPKGKIIVKRWINFAEREPLILKKLMCGFNKTKKKLTAEVSGFG